MAWVVRPVVGCWTCTKHSFRVHGTVLWQLTDRQGLCAVDQILQYVPMDGSGPSGPKSSGTFSKAGQQNVPERPCPRLQ